MFQLLLLLSMITIVVEHTNYVIKTSAPQYIIYYLKGLLCAVALQIIIIVLSENQHFIPHSS